MIQQEGMIIKQASALAGKENTLRQSMVARIDSYKDSVKQLERLLSVLPDELLDVSMTQVYRLLGL